MGQTYDHQRYSVRQFQPFSGMLQILRTEGGQAISRNGVDWQIEILTAIVSDTWCGPAASDTGKALIKFGQWNKAEGVSRVPANPILDLTQMMEESLLLVDLLQQHAQQPPFPAADRFELWLLDDTCRYPAVLLATSVRAPNPVDTGFKDEWQPPWAGQAVGKSVVRLESAIREQVRSGCRCWVERNPQGTVVPLKGEWECAGQDIDWGRFPSLLLNELWPDEETRLLAKTYHKSISPQLLTLQHLSDEQRSALELHALEYPHAVEELWRLYPRIINQDEIDAARIKSRLRNR